MKYTHKYIFFVLVVFGLYNALGNNIDPKKSIDPPTGEAPGNCDDGDACIDAEPGSVWYWRDSDGDGIGGNGSGICSTSPTPPPGYATTCHDCNDNSPTTGGPKTWYLDNDDDGYGGNTQGITSCTRPTPDHVDNNDDCDDTNDNITVEIRWYRDNDGDGFGNPNVTLYACTQPNGYVNNNDDCDDNDDTTTLLVFYADEDNDGYGDPNNTQLGCTNPIGYVSNNLDCNDNHSFINPNTQWYPDNDGDGYPNTNSTSIVQCEQPQGYATGEHDCDDTNATFNPGTVWYLDSDGDGYGDSEENYLIQCSQPNGYVLNLNPIDPLEESPLPDLSSLDITDMSMIYTVEPYEAVSTLVDLDALSEAKKMQSKTYFDGLGRPIQQISMHAGGLTPIGFNEEAIAASGWIDDWTSDNGSTPFYNQYGDDVENKRVYSVGPTGEPELLWECSNNALNENVQDGGWTTNLVTIENDKTYMYSTWVKRTGSAAEGKVMHTGSNLVSLDNNTVTATPSFVNANLPTVNEWYLLVGVIHPSGHAAGDLGISGIYDLNGNKVVDGTEWKWQSTVNTTRFGDYMYQVNGNTTRQYFYQPVLQKMDGTELSIEGILGISTGNDIINYIEYDRFGRTTKVYLPYGKLKEESGNFEVSAKSDLHTFYSVGSFENSYAQTHNPFSETVFDRSLRNRSLRQGSSADNWQIGTGHEVTYDYDFNSSNEVRHYSVSLDSNLQPTLVDNGYYPSNELVKSVVRDENWVAGVNHTAEEFKNKDGLIILKRAYVDGTTLSTYYVYDTYSNLTYILPPKAEPHSGSISNSILNELCFQYKYDHLRRQVEKRKPGVGGWEKIVYDHESRPILAQDAKMSLENKWVFTKYDKFGRIAYTGKFGTNHSREQLQDIADNWVSIDGLPQNETRIGSQELDGVAIGYTNNAFPTTNLELLTVNYYDDYNFPDTNMVAVPSTIMGQSVTANVKGLATGTWTRTLGADTWSKAYSFYDEKGRAIRVHTINHLGGHTILDSEIDFRGKVVKTVTQHEKDASSPLVSIVDQYKFDHMERLRTHKQTVYDGPTNSSNYTERIVSGFVYDAIGQLAVKYIEPKDEAFGWHLAQSNSNRVVSKSTFKKGIEGSWNPITKTSAVIVKKQSLEIQCSNHEDGAYGFYELQAGVTYNVSMDVNKKGFKDDIELSITSYKDILHHSIITESGTVNMTITPTHSGINVITFRMLSGGSSYKSPQIFSIDNFTIVESSDVPPQMTMQLMEVNALQTIDYKYNSRGSLTDINDVHDMQDDLFAYKMNYDQTTLGMASLPMYNGNISETFWKTKNDDVLRGYGYLYDALSRLKQATHTDSNYNLNLVTYDKNGNILTLNRNRGNAGTVDDFVYGYDSGNKLTALSGSKSSNYTYDVNGNMLTDSSKNITADIVYNHLNLPELVTFTNGDVIQYVYDALGTKLRKRVTQSGVETVTDYLDGFQYTQDVLQFFPQSEGYIAVDISPTNELIFSYVYSYTDHLGNVRLSYSDTNGNGSISTDEIVKENNYYPFGLLHEGYNNIVNPLASMYNYGYSGKELQLENGIAWLDFGSRNYEAELGRWMNYDRLADDPMQVDMSPYAFSLNNPVYYNDLSGDCPICIGAIFGAVVGAVVGGVSAAMNGGDFSDIVKGAAVGALSGAVAGAVATVAPGLLATAGLPSGGILGGALTGAISSAAGGIVSGGVGAALDGGDFGDILGGAASGGINGALTGFVTGGILGYFTTPARANVWTGKMPNLNPVNSIKPHGINQVGGGLDDIADDIKIPQVKTPTPDKITPPAKSTTGNNKPTVKTNPDLQTKAIRIAPAEKGRVFTSGKQHGVLKHWDEMLNYADEASALGKDVYLNKQINTALGKKVPGVGKWKPDAISIGKDNVIDLLEVVSPSQTYNQILNKMNTMQSALENLGYKVNTRIISPTYN